MGKQLQKPLSKKHRAFIHEYLVDLNATQAAIRAGYSAKTAVVQGPRLLGDARINLAIQEAQSKRLHKLELKAENVLAEIMRLAFTDARKLFREDGTLKPPQEWDDATAAAVAGVDVVEMGASKGAGPSLLYTKKVKLWDKRASLELLCRNLGLLKDRIDVVIRDKRQAAGRLAMLLGVEAEEIPE